MGGRGATSSISRGSKATILSNISSLMNNNQNLQSNTNQNNNDDGTPVVKGALTGLTQMTDDQLAQLFNASKNVDMPNHLSDADDMTQKFVYAVGLNEKPQVLDTAQFNKYLKDNNISRSDILARTTNSANYNVNGTNIKLTPDQTLQLIKDGSLNYIGGKHGGQLYGAGTYFDRNGGKPTGYGGSNSATMLAVLSKNAKPISKSQLQAQTQTWVQSHPKFAKAVGSFSNKNASIYALAQGYNVITDGSGRNASYHNVIDRSAIVVRKENY